MSYREAQALLALPMLPPLPLEEIILKQEYGESL